MSNIHHIEWHGIDLDDFSDVLDDFQLSDNASDYDPDDSSQLVPIIPERISADQTEAPRIRGQTAIEFDLPLALDVQHFNLQLAFAMTDFKVQARSLPKFIINLATHKRLPRWELKGVYVAAWDKGYDEHGLWSPTRAANALLEAEDLEKRRKQEEKKRRNQKIKEPSKQPRSRTTAAVPSSTATLPSPT